VHRNSTARLFVAVDPPADVCEQLVAWARAALRGAGTQTARGGAPRVLDPELLHITLCFLGNRATEEIHTLAERLSACGQATGELTVGAPLWLPPRRPRALAVELHDEQGRLAKLQRSVVAAVEGLDAWRPAHAPQAPPSVNHHRFRPHITVARMSSGDAPRGRALAPTPVLSFLPRELLLYRSWLSRAGASYEALASYAIG
jgi:2'-5' RNA ligase